MTFLANDEITIGNDQKIYLTAKILGKIS